MISWRALLARRATWLGPLAALAVVVLLFAVLTPETFATRSNVVLMARQTTVVGVAALGMTLVVILGGIDLSVGSSVAMTTVVVASLLERGHGPVVAACGGLVVATLGGVCNGLLIGGLRMNPFIVTLGAMSLLRGAAKGLAHEQKIDCDTRGIELLLAPLPPDRAWLLAPVGVWILFALAIGVAALLHASKLGRHVFAIGSNEATARLCGVAVGKVKVVVFGLAALLTGVAGVLELSTLTVGDPTDSVGLELEVIAAVVIGGGSLSGGEGSIVGSLIGALLMTVIKSGCTHLGLPNWVQEIVTGGVILVAVGLDRARARGSRRSSASPG